MNNVTNVLNSFLSYNKTFRYGNPSNFDRKLFGTFTSLSLPPSNVANKYTYNAYVQNTLPTQGGTITYQQSYNLYTPAWKAMYSYVGFGTQSGMTYSDNGSYYTDFFPTMNVEFTEGNVKTFAPLIKIFGTQKLKVIEANPNDTYTKNNFVDGLNTYYDQKNVSINQVLTQLFSSIQKDLPNVTETVEKPITSAIDGTQPKLEFYEAFKSFNDKWIAGNSIGQRTLMEEFLFLDRANKDIGDEFYIDISGMDKFFGCYKHATELRQRIIRETGLPISFGMSSNKTVSKVATDEVKPNNQMQILFGEEKNFLAPLSVKKIPMVGEKTYILLRSMGIEKVKTVQEMPMELMQNVLGENGISIWRKANGIDNSPVESYSEQKSMSQEETFDTDTIDVEKLKNILIAMTEKLCFRLRSQNNLTGCVTVKIRYSNFDTHNMQCRIPYTSSDHVIITRVKELFAKLYNRRLLIRLVGVKFSHLVGGGHSLFHLHGQRHVSKVGEFIQDPTSIRPQNHGQCSVAARLLGSSRL